MSIKTSVQAAGLRKVYDYIEKDPVNNLPKVGEFMDKYMPSGTALDGQLAAVKEVLGNPDNNWYKYVLSIWTDIDSGARRAIFENFVINATLKSHEAHDKVTQQYDCNVPWAVLMDPTSACNLHCTGCWAAEYGNKLNLTYEEMDSIVTQSNEMGCYFFLFSGGEPLVRKADLIRLCEAHPDC